jgi:hypothetical protein
MQLNRKHVAEDDFVLTPEKIGINDWTDRLARLLNAKNGTGI